MIIAWRRRRSLLFQGNIRISVKLSTGVRNVGCTELAVIRSDRRSQFLLSWHIHEPTNRILEWCHVSNPADITKFILRYIFVSLWTLPHWYINFRLVMALSRRILVITRTAWPPRISSFILLSWILLFILLSLKLRLPSVKIIAWYVGIYTIHWIPIVFIIHALFSVLHFTVKVVRIVSHLRLYPGWSLLSVHLFSWELISIIEWHF